MSLKSRWVGMRARCRDKNNARYGGRGIAVCKQWEDFATFEKWALANGFREDLELDRINNDGDYRPANCRFVTRLVNFQNSTAPKLTPAKVARIRGCLLHGQTKVSLAKKYGVFVETITHIQKWKTWRNIAPSAVDINSIPRRHRKNYVRQFDPITGQELARLK